MNSKLILAFSLIACTTITAASAQVGGYNANGNESRVVYGGNGLANPSGTYIGGGTMSMSARGVPQGGARANAGLPSVSMGSHVGTAGDNQYTDNPIMTGQQQTGGPGGWSDQNARQQAYIHNQVMGKYFARKQQQQRQQQMQQQGYMPQPQQNSELQQAIQRSGSGPLRYDNVGGSGRAF